MKRSVPLLLLAVLGCGGTETAVEHPRETAPAVVGALVEHAPGASSLVLRARPAELLAHPATRPVVDVLLDEAQRSALYDRTGVRVSEVESFVHAELEDRRFLRMARLPQSRAVVIANARDLRIETSSDGAITRRLGTDGVRRTELVAVDGVVVHAREAGAEVATWLEPVRRAEAPPAASAVLAALRARDADAPLAVLVPRSLGLPPDTGLGLLLARQTGLAVTIAPADEATLEVGVHLLGELPPGAESNLRAWITSMAAADLGRALGLDEAATSLSLEVDEATGAILRLRWPAARLAHGLRMLFRTEIAELTAQP